MPEANFSFYGVGLRLESDTIELLQDIRRDFSFFTSSSNHQKIIINAHSSQPPYEALPPLVAKYISPRNACYYHKHLKYIDYGGTALVVFDRICLKCNIYSADYPLLHEVCYMTILSLVSEHLDNMHLHRVHALGLEIERKSVLLLMDMGGGKTTLALKLLAGEKKIKLISEDSPLINPKGQILPFPLRIGVNEKDAPLNISERYLRQFPRQEFGPKVLIDLEYFKEKISNAPSEPYIVMLGKRVLGQKVKIEHASKYSALKEFLKNSVIGVGLFQGIEYIFKNGPKEIFLKIPLGLSRLKNALKVIEKSRVFVFYMGRDKEKNASTLLSFLQQYLVHS